MYINSFLPLLKPSQSQVASSVPGKFNPTFPASQWSGLSGVTVAQTQGSNKNRT